MKLSEEIKQEALKQAKDEAPAECCGLVGLIQGQMKYFPCINIASEPENGFALDGYEKVEDLVDEVVGLVHSHPGHSVEFSDLDRSACRSSGLHWYVVDPLTEAWGHCDPDEVSFKINTTVICRKPL